MHETAIVRCRVAAEFLPVLHFTGHEKLGTCFQFNLTVANPNYRVEPSTLLNEPAQLTFQDSTGNLRIVCARIHGVEDVNEQLNLRLRPILAHGDALHQTRVFMGKTRREIVNQVLAELGYGQHQVLWHGQINDHDLPATLLQANESQLAFVQRLLAELGCFFWFDSDGEEENLNIANNLAMTPFTPPLISLDDTQRQAMAGKDSPLRRQWTTATPSATYISHARPQRPVRPSPATHKKSEQKAAHAQQVFQPLPEAAQSRVERQNQQHHAVTRSWLLEGSLPMLACGHSSTLPAFWSPQEAVGDLTTLELTHEGEAFDASQPQLGLRYHAKATLISRASGYQPTFPAMPDLPLAFPARIEARGRYADLDDRGQYQLRMGFSHHNTERLEHTQASPSVERLVPFANANQPLNTGWHFPLLDGSTVLVTLLNNDPNRPCVLGFASELKQEGPVTDRNPSQSRIVTPGQNELTFDDELPNIILQTFDGQTKLELNAAGAQPFIKLAADYGLLRLNAGQQQRWIVRENLIQKHGGAFIEKVKTHSNVTVDGHRHLQAAKQQRVRTKADLSLISEGDQHWQTKTQGMTLRSNQAVSITSQGAQITKVSDGSYLVQAPNDITITGTGKGDLLFSNGTGGFKIDAKGNIKLFGKQITLKGQSGVTFDGNVEY